MPGELEFTAEELDALFRDDEPEETPTPSENNDNASNGTEGQPAQPSNDVPVDKTKAFAHRLKEETTKIRTQERDAIAKQFGYDSYDVMLKKREEELLKDKGLDSDDVLPVVDELVKKRLEEDPRMKELEELRAQKVKEFGERELAEIKELTNGEITKLSQLPKEVLDVWKQKGSLKSAYLEVEGPKLIQKLRSEQSKGTTSHLGNAGGSPAGESSKRHLTDDEKAVWRKVYPGISDEELSKQMVDKN